MKIYKSEGVEISLAIGYNDTEQLAWDSGREPDDNQGAAYLFK